LLIDIDLTMNFDSLIIYMTPLVLGYQSA